MAQSDGIKWILGIFVVIFLLGALIQQFSESQNTQSVALENLSAVTDVTYNLDNADIVVGTFVLMNHSFDTVSETYYTINNVSGVLNITDSRVTEDGLYNWSYANYSYYPASMVKSGVTRVLLLLTTLIIVIVFILSLVKTKKLQ